MKNNESGEFLTCKQVKEELRELLDKGYGKSTIDVILPDNTHPLMVFDVINSVAASSTNTTDTHYILLNIGFVAKIKNPVEFNLKDLFDKLQSILDIRNENNPVRTSSGTAITGIRVAKDTKYNEEVVELHTERMK